MESVFGRLEGLAAAEVIKEHKAAQQHLRNLRATRRFIERAATVDGLPTAAQIDAQIDVAERRLPAYTLLRNAVTALAGDAEAE